MRIPCKRVSSNYIVESNYELMTREPRKIARKRFMMFSCSIIYREEHIKSRHESKNQKVFKSDFKEVLYSTAKIIYSQAYPSHTETGNVYYCKVFLTEMHLHRLLEYFELCWHKKSWPTFLLANLHINIY